MIKGVLIVNSSGGLIYQKIRPASFIDAALSETSSRVDALIVFGSTVYTIMELMGSLGLCEDGRKYKRLSIRYKWGYVTALRSPTKLLFLVLHENEAYEEIVRWVDALYRKYVEEVLVNPFYMIDDPVTSEFFDPDLDRRKE